MGSKKFSSVVFINSQNSSGYGNGSFEFPFVSLEPELYNNMDSNGIFLLQSSQNITKEHVLTQNTSIYT